MREKRRFAERTKVLRSNEVKRKYFLVYEGEETEQIYFDAVNDLKGTIGINPLLELIPVVRSYSEEGWSNPRKILDRVIKNLEEVKTGSVSYETILNLIMDYFQEESSISNNRAQAANVWQTLVWICEEKMQVSLDMKVNNLPEACETIAEFFSEKSGLSDIVEDVPQIIKNGALTYDEEVDKICFIMDRDRKSFVYSQYGYVLQRCQERGFGFYLTNPCFEFWLLLHFKDVKELDGEKLLENPKVTARRRYTEQELKNRIPHFKKSCFDAESLVRDIDTAIKNEKEFCEDITELENRVGSNVGTLINEMREC